MHEVPHATGGVVGVTWDVGVGVGAAVHLFPLDVLWQTVQLPVAPSQSVFV